jgi:hypothetical protein
MRDKNPSIKVPPIPRKTEPPASSDSHFEPFFGAALGLDMSNTNIFKP